MLVFSEVVWCFVKVGVSTNFCHRPHFLQNNSVTILKRSTRAVRVGTKRLGRLPSPVGVRGEANMGLRRKVSGQLFKTPLFLKGFKIGLHARGCNEVGAWGRSFLISSSVCADFGLRLAVCKRERTF